MMTKASPRDVAAWMLEELEREGILYQDGAAYEIEQRFGQEFTCHNTNGNLAISKAVLTAFRGLSESDVVWVRSERYWRRREDWDLPGRKQP